MLNFLFSTPWTTLSVLFLVTDFTRAVRYIRYSSIRYSRSTYRYYSYGYTTSTTSARIIGGVVGGLLFLTSILAILLTCYLVCKRRRESQRLITPDVYIADDTEGEIVILSSKDMSSNLSPADMYPAATPSTYDVSTTTNVRNASNDQMTSFQTNRATTSS